MTLIVNPRLYVNTRFRKFYFEFVLFKQSIVKSKKKEMRINPVFLAGIMEMLNARTYSSPLGSYLISAPTSHILLYIGIAFQT